MGTLTQLTWLSRSALAADQEAINVTSSNVANQNTVGYTRQVVSFSALDVVNIAGSSSAAVGVEAKAVSQRDRVLEQRLQQRTQAASASDARLTALQSMEQTFGISSNSTNASTTAIGSAVDGFFSSLTALSTNPADATARGAVIAAAQTLASAFNAASRQLQDSSSTLNSQIATAANQVNALTSQVATLNGEITALSPNQDAGGLEDQRQQAIKQLSALIGVNQIAGSKNDVTLTTGNGAVLVSGENSVPLSTSVVLGATQIVGGDPASIISSAVHGGAIGGMLQARDADIPAVQEQLDALTYAVGSAVNSQNVAGQTSAGAPGTAIFSLPPTATGAAQSISLAVTATGIATAATGEGVGGTSNAVALARLSISAILNGETASGALAGLIGNVGTLVTGATTDNDAQQGALTQAQTQRDALSGVSLDEEGAALTQYQRSYEAAAKVLSIVNTLFAAAINLGVQTSVS